ncbi:3-hydroxyacyl-ACP dehydratase FabZ [Enterobacteriaceae endosymbiont of Donacia versicolorea]|uniref:3-hydroxyacyl-ACP dehydratase FabZ n=1 Tax=Enterobacteriaceae endosymbiont of Donacia versicolorea TaxID=2675788 RepID=UPI0014497F70|nr:3-hydroxyacyl-ACP dehydratase FabZ [Enterobacteriaceae endosymbiont of Donacia versicolorea]QJC32085.1 3-hydroxyacyl-ACP dehydratase FabZ [Enterobacteriaceae endosymbiont of Donacia versicolorea]
MNNKNCILDINKILYILPHRYPFILIDKVIAFKKFKFLNAIKNISINEPYFQGHFPKKPIYPGVLLLESMIQTSSILLYKSINKKKIKNKEIYYLTGIDNARFKKPAFPGDQIMIKSILKKKKKYFMSFYSIAKINNNIICKAKIMCMRVLKKKL